MHVKISLGLYLKDKPRTHLGIHQESWNIGDKPTSLYGLIYGIALTLADFHRGCGVITPQESIADIRKAATRLLESVDRMDSQLAKLDSERAARA